MLMRACGEPGQWEASELVKALMELRAAGLGYLRALASYIVDVHGFSRLGLRKLR